MRVRIVTLNVWNTEGDPRRPDIINRELRKLDPDLIAFQEVVQTPETRMLDRLLDGLDLQAAHQSVLQKFTPPFADRYGGSALATRWQHRAVEAPDLRVAGANDVPWATLAAVVTLPRLGEMLFIAATAAWRPAAEAARERQAIAITDLDARHRRDLPTVIAGDFNAAPDTASIRQSQPGGSHGQERTETSRRPVPRYVERHLLRGKEDPREPSVPHRGQCHRNTARRGGGMNDVR